MPTPRQHVNYSAVTIDGNIYIIGGIEKRNINGQFQFTISDKNEIYDPETDTWSEGASLPTARQGSAVAAIGRKIYVIGGSDTNWNFKGTVEVYDIDKDSWVTKAEMPDSCFSAGVAVVNNKIYVISGLKGKTNISRVFVYDPSLDIWQYVTDTYTGVKLAQMVSYHNKLYVLGGANTETILSYCIEGVVVERKK